MVGEDRRQGDESGLLLQWHRPPGPDGRNSGNTRGARSLAQKPYEESRNEHQRRWSRCRARQPNTGLWMRYSPPCGSLWSLCVSLGARWSLPHTDREHEERFVAKSDPLRFFSWRDCGNVSAVHNWRADLCRCLHRRFLPGEHCGCGHYFGMLCCSSVARGHKTCTGRTRPDKSRTQRSVALPATWTISHGAYAGRGRPTALYI
jgi:hypothetical protein